MLGKQGLNLSPQPRASWDDSQSLLAKPIGEEDPHAHLVGWEWKGVALCDVIVIFPGLFLDILFKNKMLVEVGHVII